MLLEWRGLMDCGIISIDNQVLLAKCDSRRT